MEPQVKTKLTTDMSDTLREILRTVPSQARAKETVNNILNTAVMLLEEVGLEAFNTNLLAERAKVRIRTVYRYFPDKYSVIVALTECLSADWDRWMDEDFDYLADPELDLETMQDRFIRLWVQKLSEQPGGVSVLKSLRTIPVLNEIDLKLLQRQTHKMANAVKMRGTKIPGPELHNICRTALVNINTGIEHYYRLPKAAQSSFLNELIKMHVAYLKLYL